MHYAGIDAHKMYLTIAVVDNQGELLREEKRVPADQGESLLAALEGMRPLEAVVETCPFWPWIHDVLEPTEVGFHLALSMDTQSYDLSGRVLLRPCSC